MAKHPFFDAWFSGIADDISQAIESGTVLVVLTVSGITAKNLERTEIVILVDGPSFKVYRYDPTSVAVEDGINVIFDTEDRPFVRIPGADAAGTSAFTPRGEYADSTVYEADDWVTDQGAGWVYISATPDLGNPPPTLPTAVNAHWQLLANLAVQTVLDALGVHAITISTLDPSGGVDGDLWFKVPA